MSKLRDLIIDHEGVRCKPYQDTATPPRTTIGVGRNLDDVGISHDEAMLMLDNDIAKATAHAQKLPYFAGLSEPRKAAIIDLIFNLGSAGLAKFQRFHKAMETGNYEWAGRELSYSLWYRQVSSRGPRIVKMITEDKWP